MPDLRVVDHPLMADRIAVLRNEATDRAGFRRALRAAAVLLAVEATTDLATKRGRVTTPLEETDAVRIAGDVVLVPVLRAGLGMLDAFLDVVPEARVGHIGLERDEVSLQPRRYFERLPEQVPVARTLVLDPMLATGGSAVHALQALREAGARELALVVLVAAPEGVAAVQAAHPDVPIIAGVLDRELDGDGFIRPGLGDAGDRVFGT
ncbi:uracil phosphoribosyltransferase [Patulibacter sp.]|uniref:uracil phosphoribosyltransferase n=1 Tax=Patulibacter sp. TaxID=1912859 RepID=UPI002717ACF8|nr:uracil phosphoribosyltransferase [Patulibacter sp.]MDO9408949.1 uracil phosphoribosyltransferase [Patulibacter sp.]